MTVMTKNLFRRGRSTALLGSLLVSAGALTAGCLERPVVEQKPNTSNVFVNLVENKVIDKIDLLFVIDNSMSMADKQKILEKAVPNMVTRLVQPDCVKRDLADVDGDGDTNEVVERTGSIADPADPTKRDCADPEFSPEFQPVNDIHIGVITSSIGGHGSGTCEDPTQNDRSLLLPKVRQGLPRAGNYDFLVWHPLQPGPEEPADTPVQGDLVQLQADFAEHVVAAGETGCGFEAPLEAFYRFLIDPAPPAGFNIENNNAISVGPDNEVLTQRTQFLRGDSLVAIVVLTDENDCSAMEGGNYYPRAGSGWFLSRSGTTFPAATPACETNPNDACCFSCFFNSALPTGCEDNSQLSACTGAGQPRLAPTDDRANTRCFQNKRRFGLDLLYPTSRYVQGLSSKKIINSQTGQEEDNPLFAQNRPQDFVFFAGIVGIPWQDIADERSLTDANYLKYLTAAQLAQLVTDQTFDRWSLILGEPYKAANSRDCQGENAECGKAPTPPLDPFMIESILPRVGTNPLTGVSTVFPQAEPGANLAALFDAGLPHEYNNNVPFDKTFLGAGTGDSTPANDDLQYSCIFPLDPYDGIKSGADCDDTSDPCDCSDEEGDADSKGRPLCKQTPTAVAGKAQYWGKAYPATRVLEVLRDFGNNSIIASICPKVHDETNASAFGYNPAVGAIVDRLAEKLGGQCLQRELTVEDGVVPCSVVEALDDPAGLNCDPANGRNQVNEKIEAAVRKQLEASGLCVGAACDAYSLCEIAQLEQGTDQGNVCLNDTGDVNSFSPGYCYVDPAKGLGNELLVANCPSTQKRLLRFVGNNTPVKNSITFVACTANAAQPTVEQVETEGE